MKRPLVIAIVGAIVVLVAVLLAFFALEGQNSDAPFSLTEPAVEQPSASAPMPAPESAAPSGATENSPPAEPEPAPMVPPTFDVVRIDPEGNTVIAGKSEAGAEIEVLDGPDSVGKVTANGGGEWVFLPDTPLPPGSRELSLVARNDKGEEVASEDVVVLIVPERDGDGALAVRTDRDGGNSQVLQGGARSTDDNPVVISAVDYMENGSLMLSGEAKPGAKVHVYLDDAPIGEATADDQGRWSLEPESKASLGNHTLRVDMVNPDGSVIARAKRDFERVNMADLTDQTRVVVQPGNSLWVLARHAYGDGNAYTVIFKANKDQIADPNQIYPGQVFVVPNR